MIRDTARLKNLNSPDPLRTPLEARVRRRPLRHAVSFAAPRGQTLQHQLGRQLGQLARASVLAPLKSEACQRSQGFHWIVAVEPGTIGQGLADLPKTFEQRGGALRTGRGGRGHCRLHPDTVLGIRVRLCFPNPWLFDIDSAGMTNHDDPKWASSCA